MLFCESGIRESRAGRPTEGKALPTKESRSDENDHRSATESACTRASARRDAEPRSGSNTLTDREPLLERKLETTF